MAKKDHRKPEEKQTRRIPKRIKNPADLRRVWEEAQGITRNSGNVRGIKQDTSQGG